jgi:large subunit ribosomal protein L25
MDVMIKDIQLDLLKGILLHLDFFRVAKGEKISVDVPVAIRGEQEVEKAGLVIQHQLRQVKVEAVPGTIPDAAIANVSGLGAGDSLTVADLSLTGEGVILDAGDEVVLSIIAPRAVTVHEDEEGEEAEQEAEEPAENPE